jgi:hypothetical protein
MSLVLLLCVTSPRAPSYFRASGLGGPGRRFSRAYVIHYPPLLLPGLSACSPTTSSKIIPRMSREASDWPRRPPLVSLARSG